jgi:hypothetical protein
MSYIGNQPQYTSFLSDTFSGNGSTTVYTMAVAPANTAAIIVAIWGVLQDPSTYGVVGRILTFSQAPPAGTGNISVRYLALPASNITTTAYRSVSEFTATAGQTTFTPASYTPGFINVFRSGVRLGATNFTATNGVTVVLNNAADAGDLITVESFFVSAVLNAIPAVPGQITPALLDSTSQLGTGALLIPTGTTAQRPASPANGMIRKNTTTGYVEFWDPSSSSWVGIGAFSATGGTVVTSGGFTYHVFTTSGNFQVVSGSRNIDYIVVAGGGGSGNNNSGGGGAGGFVGVSNVNANVGSYTVTVGGGGASVSAVGNSGSNGSNSSFLSSTAIGGGGGMGGNFGVNGSGGPVAGSGGSGGGQSRSVGSPGSGTAGQGTAGRNNPSGPRGGGGGGATVGGGSSGDGGNGTSAYSDWGAATGTGQNISGTRWYAGGGGGSAEGGGNTSGIGGNGGGGRGGASNGATGGGGWALGTGENGTANTGGGGGGNDQPIGGGVGGSGIVIIRYLSV